MKLVLTPRRTLFQALSVTTIGVFLLPTLVTGFDIWARERFENESHLGPTALAFLLCGAFGALMRPALVSARTRVTEFEAALPMTRRAVTRERGLRLWLCLGFPVVVAAALFTFPLVSGLHHWMVAHDTTATASELWLRAALALMGHATFAALLFAYRPRKPKLGTLELRLAIALLATAVAAPILLVPKLAPLILGLEFALSLIHI